MAMTKAEKAAFEQLQLERDLLQAQMRLPYLVREVCSDPDCSATAWCFNSYSKQVSQGKFGGGVHKTDLRQEFNSQRHGGPWFVTKADALKAMRNQIAARFFRELEMLDREIAKYETDS